MRESQTIAAISTRLGKEESDYSHQRARSFIDRGQNSAPSVREQD